jgi:succinyldiaminopimelate transaminase
VGTPVDPTPDVVQDALAAAADAPGYPTAAGEPALRRACAQWLGRCHGVDIDTEAIVPAIGSKELIASLPRVLGLGPGDTVAGPRIGYPTYAVSALLGDARWVATDEPDRLADVRFVWLNTPSNPTGRVLAVERLAEIVRWARGVGAVVVSDECYIDLGWDAEPMSVLHPDVVGGSHAGVLAVHSLSKRSNLAGYRFGFAAGDGDLVRAVLAYRKHAGLLVPTPVQRAAVAALGDDAHVAEQRDRYGRRRAVLRAALVGAGFRIDASEAGLYLWATRGEPCWTTVDWLADRGILVAPGAFYGEAGAEHVRVALTATDAAVASASARLAAA